MVGNGARVVETFRLDEHHLQLCGCMDVDHFVAALRGILRNTGRDFVIRFRNKVHLFVHLVFKIVILGIAHQILEFLN
ncbi:hypothetical protein SDC9_172168 [bioreactor metagenome]|uniref:Uncharacterized protein n=1 Tax=bioreactor metagenome TaxID=1076179 RepID=A0A645GF43_9ZZZZ